MDVSCAFPPGREVIEHIEVAESLGYERAWLYDSPALYPDVWATLALAAERTDHIGLGPAVLIPSLRHVLAQATAIATLESWARALEAAGPALTVVYHGMYEADPAAVDSFPGGPQWRTIVEDVPPNVRHLTVHEDHLVRVTERDEPLLDGHTLAAFTWTGSSRQLRGRLDELEAAGATEILYAPMGPDVPRELEAFAAMAGKR